MMNVRDRAIAALLEEMWCWDEVPATLTREQTQKRAAKYVDAVLLEVLNEVLAMATDLGDREPLGHELAYVIADRVAPRRPRPPDRVADTYTINNLAGRPVVETEEDPS